MTGLLFHFSDEQWETISQDLRKSASFNANVCRLEVSIVCGGFVHLRPVHWQRFAITREGEQGMARHMLARRKSFNSQYPNCARRAPRTSTYLATIAKGDEWAAQLPLVISSAKESARLELMRRPKANNADPHRDNLVHSLVSVWLNHTGERKVPHTEDGPLMRFLVAITTPTLIAADESRSQPIRCAAFSGKGEFRAELVFSSPYRNSISLPTLSYRNLTAREGRDMTTLIERYRNRREAAEYLTSKGLRTSWRTLQKLATVGGGPRYRIFGRIAVYTDEDLDAYATSKLSAPRYSTSEAA